jgi:hypothetical protein
MTNCIHCGVSAKIYKFNNDVVIYYDEAGKRMDKIPECISLKRAYQPTPSLLDGIPKKKFELPDEETKEEETPIIDDAIEPVSLTETEEIPKEIEEHSSSEEYTITKEDYENQPFEPVHTGRHRWMYREIPEGKKSVDEKCKCGLISVRFQSNNRFYREKDGKLVQKITNGCSISYDEHDVPKRQYKRKDKPIINAGGGSTEHSGDNGLLQEQHANEPGILDVPVVLHNEINNQGPGRDRDYKHGIPVITKDRTTNGKKQEKDIEETIDFKARLEETIVILNVVFEEMVKRDFYSKGRDMTGRFLYSHEYEELVKGLERR